MADPLLTLQTLTEYPTVAIDGVAYALTPVEALAIVQVFTLERLRARITTLNQQLVGGENTAAIGEEAEAAINELVALVLVAPAEVLAKLTTVQKMRIAQAFIELPQTTALSAVAPARATTMPTGARSRRGSRGSTAETRSTGSRASRSASSAH